MKAILDKLIFGGPNEWKVLVPLHVALVVWMTTADVKTYVLYARVAGAIARLLGL